MIDVSLYEKILFLMRRFPDFNFSPEEEWAELISAEPDFRKGEVKFWRKDYICSSQNVDPSMLLLALTFDQIGGYDLGEIINMIKEKTEK